MAERVRVTISGQVQGVGFRPTLYRYAVEAELVGFVANISEGVIAEVQGAGESIEQFLHHLVDNPPPLAQIDTVTRVDIPEEPAISRLSGFQILASSISNAGGTPLASLPPDLGTCEQCRQEIFDPKNRRYRYPFTSCTDCGPRFTLAEGLPYDRERTAMKSFSLCPACAGEYYSVQDRRFEAQLNACADCGPELTCLDGQGRPLAGDPITLAATLLNNGEILAIKGLGGYHLACSALNRTAIARLRAAKKRPAKALAVMFASLEQLQGFCVVNEVERSVLTSWQGPIVLCTKKAGCTLLGELFPDTGNIGALLAYTPLHHLLLDKTGPLVMTSGNRCGRPLAHNEKELADILGSVASHALVHNRSVVRRCDDSVVRIIDKQQLVIRRSRGYVPQQIPLPFSGPSVLACGGDLKNTFCITQGRSAFLSQHIGDLKELSVFRFYEEAIKDFTDLLAVQPEIVACDLHLDYRSSRFAQSLHGVRCSPVQHHHAHIASCMAENLLTEKVIGVAFDGSGAGTDNTVWGGEFLIADYCGFQRVAHCKPYPLPGGEQAIAQPWRMALSYMISEYPDSTPPHSFAVHRTDEEYNGVVSLIRSGFAPLTSSCGRLFDAVAALLGVCSVSSYEGQAAVRLENLVRPESKGRYTFVLASEIFPAQLSFGPALGEIIADLDKGLELTVISTKFHNTVSAAVVATCEHLRQQRGINTVVLSGGVFQNAFLLQQVCTGLRRKEFAVFCHHLVPPNDGGLSLGQAAVALAQAQDNRATDKN
ncbi:carbamoyltransferase HypF [Candidatus Electrothrix aarhusensis]